MDKPISSNIDQIKAHYTAVVIGSGYGGGIAASRLSRAGQSVCLLERGREIRPGNYPSSELAAVAEMQLDFPCAHEGSKSALFDFHINDQMSVLVGCGLGGTSLINANVGLTATPAVFQDQRWPEELRSPGVLDSGYQRAREMLEPTTYPDDMPTLTKLEALKRSAEAMTGAAFAKAPLYVTFTTPEGGVNKFSPPARSARPRSCSAPSSRACPPPIWWASASPGTATSSGSRITGTRRSTASASSRRRTRRPGPVSRPSLTPAPSRRWTAT